MLTLKPFQFNSENIASILTYSNKWQRVAGNTAPLDRKAANTAINQAYEFLELAKPNIIFFNDPYDALKYIRREINAY